MVSAERDVTEKSTIEKNTLWMNELFIFKMEGKWRFNKKIGSKYIFDGGNEYLVFISKFEQIFIG